MPHYRDNIWKCCWITGILQFQPAPSNPHSAPPWLLWGVRPSQAPHCCCFLISILGHQKRTRKGLGCINGTPLRLCPPQVWADGDAAIICSVKAVLPSKQIWEVSQYDQIKFSVEDLSIMLLCHFRICFYSAGSWSTVCLSFICPMMLHHLCPHNWHIHWHE